MKRILFCLLLTGIIPAAYGQSVSQKLAKSIQQLERDPQMRHAIVSLYVIDAASGKKLFGHNHQAGLAPASTQKIFTSVAAFELLGKDFRYKTQLGYRGTIGEGVLNGSLEITGSGDPTLGSWRWKETRDTVILQQWVEDIRKAGITHRVEGVVNTTGPRFSQQAIPDGWIWQDIGNYYGAGAYPINWRENQYDLFLRSGSRPGDSVHVDSSRPGHMAHDTYINELTAGPKGSGDNAYIYFGLGQRSPLLKGSIPAGESSFSISGASYDPATQLALDLTIALRGESVVAALWGAGNQRGGAGNDDAKELKIISTHLSPPLDSINYWFQRRSVNLYGEALIKTIALEKNGYGSTENGVEIVRDFFSGIGIDKAAIHIMDGSGLSPQNRVTTRSLVKVLQYARTRHWFASFYHALPVYNGMKMKSGSISGARAYAGYHTSKNGKEYIFSIIINNYDGSAGQVVRKMYEVLNELK